MPEVDDYIATLTPDQKTVFERMSKIVQTTVPSVEQGVRYAMPAFLYKGKSLISFIARKNHLSIYPFSGKVIDKLQVELRDYSLSSGTIRFSEEQQIPEALLREIVMTRLEEINGKNPQND